MTSQVNVVRNASENGWESFAGLNSGVIHLDVQGHLTVCNELAAQLLDVYIPVGTPQLLESCLGPDREETQLLRQLVSDQLELRNQLVTWTEMGRVRHILIDAYLHRSTDPNLYGNANVEAYGDVLGIYVVMKDLGNFIVMEQHMQRTDKLATVGKVAAGVAHEIRNPLTTVKGFLQVLASRFNPGEQSEELEYAQVMLAEIDKVDELVKELLLLSKPHQLQKRSIRVETLLEQVWPWIESQSTAGSVAAEHVVDDVPIISGEPEMLKHVIQQLAENAIDAMDSGGTLTIHVHSAGRHVQIDVHDTGPGIPYYQMDKVFDAFFTTKEKGTGLGLPICQRIVADHGGEIRVASKGFGTTFSVLLPTE